ncbi:hypothetical protein [Priestia koreensis]|uniref:hypothetical protein n=1 Tax=Priestia koreensis TaxID=284581 RepID=UPI001F58A191|nr:hypothetical protein [Priestia koreensis]UNL85813.1 hypothetical protein IE339_04680 [Priestia koreensis]
MDLQTFYDRIDHSNDVTVLQNEATIITHILEHAVPYSEDYCANIQRLQYIYTRMTQLLAEFPA